LKRGAELRPVLEMNGITKRFGRLVANENLSITLHSGEVLALLGENGAGKSTLMSILFGHYVADAGTIDVFGQRLPRGDTQAALAAGVGMVHQHFALAENLSVLDNVLVGADALWRPRLSSVAQRAKLTETAAAYGLEVDPDALVSSLSMGGRQRVEILKALTRGAKILILDEPTAILTPQESESLFATLKGFVVKGLSIIFISHKLNEVLRVSDRVVVLRGGKLVAELAAAGASPIDLATLMVGDSALLEEDARLTRPEKKIEASAAVLNVRSLSGKSVRGVTLKIHAGEVFGIAGVSGNGQSELADLLSGVVMPTAGDALLDQVAYPLGQDSAADAIKVGIARIPEDRTLRGIVGDASLIENICIGRHRSEQFQNYSRGFLGRMKRLIGWLNHGERSTQAKSVLEQFDVRHAGVEGATQALSGGNIQKLVLARELGLAPDEIRVLIANQPTWGLDVGAVSYVHQQIQRTSDRGAAVLLISDELDEIFALCDTIAVMFKGMLSEPKPASEWTRAQLGLAMAGADVDTDDVEMANAS
jgi:general nucleoside transport system ATP-binding protein